MTTTKRTTIHQVLEAIAQQQLDIETLETQGSDRLDFREVYVAQLKDALRQAYDAGAAAATANCKRNLR